MKVYEIIKVFLIVVPISVSWKAAPNRMTYHTLKWSDFRGCNNLHGDEVAILKWDWEYRSEVNDKGEWRFSVKNYFIPGESSTLTSDPYVLLHEQVHLWIAQSESDFLQERLNEINGCKNCEWIGDSLYSSFFDEASKTQDYYDSCTQHSRDRILQKKWNDRLMQYEKRN